MSPMPPVESDLPPPPPPPPVPALAYTVPHSARPGIITAIGVISIVVASFSMLANLWTGISLFGFSMFASFAGMTATTTAQMGATPTPAGIATTLPATTQPAATSIVVSARGLDATERAEVATGLSETYLVDALRLDQLDALLAQAGKDIFPTGGKPLKADDIEEVVLGHAIGLSADPNVNGPDTFRTKGGRFELYDDRAVFYPTRGEIVRVSTQTTSNAGLTPEEVETVIQQAQAQGGNMLNTAQIAALRTLLTTPGQQHVRSVTVPTAIRSVSSDGGGNVTIIFPNGFATIGPQGQITNTATGGNPFGFAGGGTIKLNGAALALAWFAALASFGLAVYLLIVGILTLRNSPSGRKLHLIYAVLKFPVTILGAVAVWWLTSSFMEAILGSNPAAAGMAAPMNFIGIQQAVLAAIGLAYPIALLIALQSRSVKNYYASVVE